MNRRAFLSFLSAAPAALPLAAAQALSAAPGGIAWAPYSDRAVMRVHLSSIALEGVKELRASSTGAAA